MTMYPVNPALGQKIQSGVQGNTPDLGFLAHLQWTAPAALSNTAVKAAVTLAVGATTTVTTGITNPDVPRALIVKGNQAGVAGNVVITGTNINNEVITETIVAVDNTAVNGAKAFKTVTQIVFPQQVGAGDTISIGYNNKLGLQYKLAHNTVVFAFLGNVKEGTAPTVATSTSAFENNTLVLNSVLNATVVDVYLIV